MATLETGFVVPTLATLIERVSSDINTRIPGQDSRIRQSLLWVLARVIAGAVWTLYGFQSWIMQQVFADSATDLTRRQASIWGVTPTTATPAIGNATVYGVAGANIPAGTVLQTVAGVQYDTDAIYAIPGAGFGDVAVTAVENGDDGNATAATVLTFVSPPAGVNSIAYVATGGLAGGTDDESDEDLRERVLQFIRDRPHGGALADYETWGLEVAGVDRVWVYGEVNTVGLTIAAGDVDVYFTTDVGGSVIPGAPLIATVQAYINDRARRPVTAKVTAKAPTPHSVDMTIDLHTDTTAIRAAVQDELEALFLASAEVGGTIYNSQLHEAVSRAQGETSHTFTAVDGGAGTSDVVCTAPELAVLGTITWV